MSAPPPLARALDLAPHPEGGWFRRTWATGPTLQPAGYPGPRVSATAIHYVLAPGEESRWHRVRSDELWCWHRGPALSLWLGGDGEHPVEADAIVLGARVEDGQAPHALVPGGVWQRAAPEPGADAEVLVTCVVSPGFDEDDFTLARAR
ncbi:cupin domain-containing protein [Actinomycetospora callitridis]|uniref:cupin domain-containing protein n=1 Tax=Actinomycetospora callitridis TaxID=913944 RepID=UPI002365AD7C|nr:cupin domain-containing protein [Actinomycetospora callitridis]MDD7920961.1 cupin domain-containing protein [Actinomycetospora callitridis]